MTTETHRVIDEAHRLRNEERVIVGLDEAAKLLSEAQLALCQVQDTIEALTLASRKGLSP